MRSINVNEFLNSEFDYILDARSPREFEESHIPGSENFYVLDNDQHAYIGNMYTNVSKFQAKKEAVGFMLENISAQLKNFDAKPGNRIVVYCARGGKRSTALATILSQLDFVVYKLEGGYKAYRKWVVEYLQNFPHKKFIVLRGNSGCGKSELLEHLHPSLDLEKLANHFGSNFGSRGTQPSQKQFENEIADFLYKTNPDEVIFTEAEGNKIGKLFVPNLLQKRMHSSVHVEITADLDDRVKRIINYYGDISEKEFYSNMEKIKKFISKKEYEKIVSLFEKGDIYGVVENLLINYYDRVYRKKHAQYSIHNNDIQKTVQKLMEIKSGVYV